MVKFLDTLRDSLNKTPSSKNTSKGLNFGKKISKIRVGVMSVFLSISGHTFANDSDNQGSGEVKEESKLKINGASTNSQGAQASFSYGDLNLSTQTGDTTTLSAGYRVNKDLRLTGTTGENNNTAGVQYTLNDQTTFNAKGGDNNGASVKYKVDNNISLSGQFDDRNGAGVGAMYASNDGKIRSSISQSANGSSANVSHSGIKIKNEPLVLNAGVTYQDSDVGFTLSAGQIFDADFAYKLLYEKQDNQSTILAKAVYGINENFYLQAMYGELKKTGLEYSYEQFSQPGFVKGLSFGEGTQDYDVKQDTYGVGVTYVKDANLVSVNYTYSETPNQTFDKRVSVTQEGNLLVTRDILAGAAGYEHHELIADVEYQIVPRFALTGQIGYEITKLKQLYNLPEEESNNVVWGVGGKYTSKSFSVLGRDVRTQVEASYREQDFNKTSGIKVVFEIKGSWLQEHGLYPYVGFEKNEYDNGIDEERFTVGITGHFGDTGIKKGMSHIINKDNRITWKGPTDRIGQQITETGRYNTDAGELVQSETIENAHDYIIDLGAVSLTGEFISNVASVEQFIKIENNKLVLIGVNSGNFDAIAGQLFKLGLTQTNGNVLIVKLFNEQGSFNITKIPGSVGGVSTETATAFVESINANYNSNQIDDIIDLLFSGDITVATAKNIFDGTINPSIVKTGLLTGVISPTVLNFISDNIGSINQPNLVDLIQNTGQGETITIQDITTLGADTIPDAFTFTDPTNVALTTLTQSNIITVAGINTSTAISITGGEYSVNGGTFTSTQGTLENGNTVQVRITSSSNFNTLVQSTLNIGGVTDIFDVTTLGADTTPDVFSFTDVTNIALSTVTTSNTFTLSGLNTSTAISVTGGEYSVNGGTFTGVAGIVVNGDTVQVRITSSTILGTTTQSTLNIGGITDVFDVTTLGADTTPDVFSFTDVTNIALSTVTTSNTFTLSGLNTSTVISVTGGEYSVNGGTFTSVAGTVSNGDTVQVRITSSAILGTTTQSTLDIGGVTDIFDVTTLGADTTPDVFSFTDETNTALSTDTESNTFTLSGLNTSTVISVTGGEYSVNGGTFTSVAGTVSNGDTVQVRITSSSNFNTLVQSTLDIGGVTDIFNVTTLGADKIPDVFSFTDETNIALSTVTTSNTFTLSGLNTSTAISITGGEYSVNGGTFTSTVGTVVNGDTVQVRITSSSEFNTLVQSTLDIGGVTDIFDVTTLVNTAPLASDFTTVTQGQSGTILKTEIDPNISDIEQADSDLNTIITSFDSAGLASAVVDASNNILWTAADGFEGTTTISYRANDGFLNSSVQTITLDVDKKAPSISSQVITLTLQNTAFSGQTVIVNDLNDIDQGNTSLAFITPGDVNSTPGGTITITSVTKINATQSLITFSGSTPSVEFLQIKTTVEDEFGNRLQDDILPGLLNLSAPNSAPVLSQTTFTLDAGGNNSQSFDLSTILSDDSTTISNITVVPVDVDNSKFTHSLVGNTFTVNRIDNSATPLEEISVQFEDEGNLKSEVLTIRLERFDDF